MVRLEKLALSSAARVRNASVDIAQWVLAVAEDASPLAYDLIDLADVALPFSDEPLMAALGNYQHEHTKRWSKLVPSYDVFVFVMPQ